MTTQHGLCHVRRGHNLTGMIRTQAAKDAD